MEVVAIVGPSCSGKTQYVTNKYKDDLYTYQPGGKNYNGQSVLLIDGLPYSVMKRAELLNLLEPGANWRKVFLISNADPECWYEDTTDLESRITNLVHVKTYNDFAGLDL